LDELRNLGSKLTNMQTDKEGMEGTVESKPVEFGVVNSRPK